MTNEEALLEIEELKGEIAQLKEDIAAGSAEIHKSTAEIRAWLEAHPIPEKHTKEIQAARRVSDYYWHEKLNCPVLIAGDVEAGVVSAVVLPWDLSYHIIIQPLEIDVEDLVPLTLAVDELKY